MSVGPYILLLFTNLFWSFNLIIGKLVGGVIPPSTISFLRWFFPLLFFLPFAWKDIKKNAPVYKKHWLLILILGITGYCLNSICVYSSVRYTSVINTSFINCFNPVLIALTGFFMYRYPIKINQILGFIISLIGVIWIIFKGNPVHLMTMHVNIGDLFMVGSISLWSFHTILYKRYLNVLPLKSFFVIMMFTGVILTIPFMMSENIIGGIDWLNKIRFLHIIGILCLNIFPSILAYRFWNKALEKIPANKVAIFLYLIPVYTVIISLLFLDERLKTFQVIGGVLIFLGVFLVTNKLFEKAEKSKEFAEME